MPKKKHKPLPPRRKRMRRPARLQSAKNWLRTFTGKNVIRSYAKWYGVDRMCAVKELQLLGVELPADQLESLRVTSPRQGESRSKKNSPTELSEGYGTEWDDTFAFIAGRTSGGMPYGVTRSAPTID